jgi:hypothetical protein
MFPAGPNDDTVDASGQAINETREGANTLLKLYEALNAQDAQAAAERERPRQSAPVHIIPRTWSESIRIIGMGIRPAEMPSPEELDDWVLFCEANSQTERALFARQLQQPQEAQP